MISCSFWTRDRTPGRRNSPSLWEAVSLMYCRALVMHGATARPVWRSRDVRDEPNTPFVSVSVASMLPDDVINSLRKRIAFQVAINPQSVRHWLELHKFRMPWMDRQTDRIESLYAMRRIVKILMVCGCRGALLRRHEEKKKKNGSNSRQWRADEG